MMLNKKILFPLFFLLSSSFIWADTSDEDIRKALEGISQTQVIKASEPKTVSTVLEKEEVVKKKTTPIKKKKITKKKRIKKKYSKKRVKKRNKKIHKKRRKKSHKKKAKPVDFSKLQDVETLGVVRTSEPFQLKK